MTAEQLRSFFKREGVTYEENELATGNKFRCSGGEIFVAYYTGKLAVQGKVTELTKKVRALSAPMAAAAVPAVGVAASAAQTSPTSRPIFIVYGHDSTARNDLELLLRQMGLAPVVLQNLPPGGDTIIEKLEAYVGTRGTVGFACVLLTPDDEGYKKGAPHEAKSRARQNVVLELGMVLARLGRRNVAILKQESVERPSDIDGLIYIPFTNKVQEGTLKLLQALNAAGYECKTDALG
jgi:predicted nucleotide-binding protein